MRSFFRAKKKPAKIGIPRALYYYLYPGLWESFFEELGIEVVVSCATTARTLEMAGLISEAEHCFPLKMFDAHLSELVKQVEVVFVPRILSGLVDHIACPKLGAVPDAAMAEIARDVTVLTVDIDERCTPLGESLTALGRQLGVGRRVAGRAASRALLALDVARRAHGAQRGVEADGDRKWFLMLGHPYNLHDSFVSGPILEKLELLGVAVRLFDHGESSVSDGPIRWDTCSRMHHTLQGLSVDECAGVIQISSFNCGCDSIAIAMFRDILRDRGIPYMVLVLDGHTARAGLDTRLEAFVDSIRW